MSPRTVVLVVLLHVQNAAVLAGHAVGHHAFLEAGDHENELQALVVDNIDVPDDVNYQCLYEPLFLFQKG